LLPDSAVFSEPEGQPVTMAASSGSKYKVLFMQ
jgi:hypothetical protein